MKNFTKTITNKTLFKPTRWLIIALMMLVGTSSAWGKTLYIYSTNSNSYAWIWNKSNNNNFTGGSWPGAKLNNTTYFTSLGNNWYKFKTDITVEYGLILSGGASNGQTGDIFINDAVYCIKHNGGNSYENYGPPSGYNIAGSFTDWANSAKNFSSFSDNKQAYSMAAIELGSGTHKLKIRKGSTWYGSSSDNSRGNLKFDSKDGEGNITFTLSTAKKVTFYFDPAADKAFADAVDACSAPTSVSISRGDNSTANICEGNTVNLTATVDGSGDITYKWEKLSGTNWSVSANSTSQTCTVTAGTGEAEFKITATRCSTSKTSTIKLTADTKSALSLTNKTICDGTTINLGDDCIASNTGTVTWYSNSGLTTVVSNLDVTPHTNPTYYYAVAKNGVCANSATQTLTITVDPQPAIELSETEISICNGETVAFTDHIENYEGTVTWYKDEAMSQAVGSVTDKPTATTTYYAKVVSGVCANYETASLKVNVNDKPAKPTISAKDNKTALVSGESTVLSVNNAVEGVTYTWYRENAGIVHTGATYTTSVAGKYTVIANANNGCGDSDASDAIEITVCVPISDLTWTITSGAKTTYCPGDKVTVTMTYNGTTAKDYDWGGNYDGNIGLSGGSIASGAVYTMTINKPGTVNLTLTGCNGAPATTPTLEFTTHETPDTPTITFSANPVGQSKETILSIASYNANNNYIVYRSADNAVGNDTEVGTYTAPMSIRHDDTGSYYYYAKATNKSCANLTATSEIVKLDVQEAGAIIAALGDLKVDPQDPVDFVAMYVKNDGLSDYTDQGATEVTGYTWQFSSDEGNTWTDCASTNTVAGVNYALGMGNGSVNCNNFRPNVAGKYRCVVKYNVGEQPSNILTVTSDGSTAKTFKGVTMTLPVISVNTGEGNFPVNDFGGTPSKNADKMKEKISVDVKIFENINGTTQVVYDRKARMNYRGSSSMNFLKKSYAFCPGDEMCGDKKGVDYVKTAKLNMLGIGNALDKDWVLYAAAADPSLMRNRLMFDTFRDMTGGWSVNSRYVELVVNGEYRGVYVMMDKITKNDNRINVKWKIDKNTGETTQKGFIIKLDKTDIVDRYENNGDKKTFKSKYSGHDGFETYDTEIDQRFEIEYPEKEDIEDDGGDWSIVYNEILGMVNKFEEELAKGNFTEVQKLIDYESWADWFIITEYGKNIDGYRASNLFVFDENGKGKLEARPLWDQELSFNNQCPSYYGSYGSSNTSGLLIDKTNSAVYDNDASAPFWFTGKYKGGRGTYNGSDQTFKGLLDDPCFVAVLQSRWEKHVSGALSQKSLTDKENNYISELGNIGTNGTPMNRELKFWQNNKGRHYIDCGTGAEKSCYNGTTGYSSYNTSESITQSATDLTNWLTGDRRTNLGNIINNMEGTDLRISLTMTPANGETTPWEAVMVEVNNPSGYDYDLEYTTNTLDKVEGVIINENNDKYTYRIPRPSTWGTGDGERDAIEYGIQAILNVSDDNLQCGTINEEFTKADVTITLKDEEDDDCSIVEP